MIVRVLKWMLGMAAFLVLMLFTGMEGVSLYVQKKLQPEMVSEHVHSPQIALDLLWVSLGEESEIRSRPFSVSSLLLRIATDDFSGMSPYLMVSRLKLLNSKKRVLGGHPDSLGLASWLSQNGSNLIMLQYILDHSYYGLPGSGVENASRYIFGKTEASLTLSEWVLVIAAWRRPHLLREISEGDSDGLERLSLQLFESAQKNWPEKYGGKNFVFPDMTHYRNMNATYHGCLIAAGSGDKGALDACREEWNVLP